MNRTLGAPLLKGGSDDKPAHSRMKRSLIGIMSASLKALRLHQKASTHQRSSTNLLQTCPALPHVLTSTVTVTTQ